MKLRALVLAASLCAACSSDGGTPGSKPVAQTDSEHEAQAASAMHDLLLADIKDLESAVMDLCGAAPAPSGRGWDATADAAALDAMRGAWKRARSAYELGEGAIAPLFPDIDFAIDARYDDFLAQLPPPYDDDPFDGVGVTGMHAIERILWSDDTPERVVEFESRLPGYVIAAFPSNETEAGDFRDGLCPRLVADISDLEAQWKPLRLHVAIAFQGLVSLMNEQREKVRKAASNEEESRYSQRTLVDLRDNLAGTRAAVSVFQPWLESKHGGSELVRELNGNFDALDAAYSAVPGDAFPEPPSTFSAEHPSAEDLDSPFGRLFVTVGAAADPNDADSVVAHMEAAGHLLGLSLPPP